MSGIPNSPPTYRPGCSTLCSRGSRSPGDTNCSPGAKEVSELRPSSGGGALILDAILCTASAALSRKAPDPATKLRSEVRIVRNPRKSSTLLGMRQERIACTVLIPARLMSAFHGSRGLEAVILRILAAPLTRRVRRIVGKRVTTAYQKRGLKLRRVHGRVLQHLWYRLKCQARLCEMSISRLLALLLWLAGKAEYQTRPIARTEEFYFVETSRFRAGNLHTERNLKSRPTLIARVLNRW